MAGTVDFANILFAGPCNRFCPWCIGKQLPPSANANNLNAFPPKNIDGLIAAVNELGIDQIVFTGTVTDPQLYRHEARLLDLLRQRIRHPAQFSLHTNGVLALRRMPIVNMYDKVCISFPSFVPVTYFKLMGSRHVPDLQRIVEAAQVPVKVSCVVNEHNVNEIDRFLKRCSQIGITRVVLRRLVGDTRNWNPLTAFRPSHFYRSNPVYIVRGMEVTYWNFDCSESSSINLFSNGVLGTSYLLTETAQLATQTAS